MLFLRPLLGLFIKDVVEDSAKKMAANQIRARASEAIRVEFLRVVAEGYTKELTYNLSQYVKSIGESSALIDSNNSGEKLFTSFQLALKKLESELEEQGEDSPVIKYLKEKYTPKSSSLIGLPTQPVYMMVKGVEESNWSDQPWLNRILNTSPEIGDILADEALRIFETLFPPAEIS